MLNKIVLLFISIADYFHKKKIIKFLNEKALTKFNCIIDVGAHHGESIEFFLKNFQIKKIYSFEPVAQAFEKLKKNTNHLTTNKNIELTLENMALGSSDKNVKIKQMIESSSSTLREINLESKYFSKKKKLLYSGRNDFYKIVEVKQVKLKNYIQQKSINKIDFLKIDTEGYELDVLLGLEEEIKNVKIIIFEHHYHDMIKKNYTFLNIHGYLITNNFKQIYKSKMPFRKTFEYIYENKSN